MSSKRNLKSFDDRVLNQYPDLKEALKECDEYAELNHLKSKVNKLPLGSFNIRIIINKGQIVERVYQTPQGEVISLFPKPSNIFDFKAS
tara:strand:+ start:219 stop:485 length:267 start_codon:yes stop_codon:yes gene_type:complete